MIVDNKSKLALVTGAGGFVGANLVIRLLSQGLNVHCLLRPGHEPWRLKQVTGLYTAHDIDLVEYEKITNLINHLKPQLIFHCATYGAYPTQNIFEQALNTNVFDTLHFIRSCFIPEVEAIIYTGSSSEYGIKERAPLETEGLEPQSAYAATKAAATLLLRYLAQANNAPLCILRLYSVYGPLEEPSRLIPALLLAGMTKKWPPMAERSTARDFI
ncbi:MAG: NAD-dependent epimerase/dehydratase family protein, partial [Candidatus Saccharimonadales bacterium]